MSIDKNALLFPYSWLDLIETIVEPKDQLAVIKAVFEHDKKTAEELTAEERNKELEQFKDNDYAMRVFMYIAKKTDASYDRFMQKYRGQQWE